ncbi:MAG: PAS domain S-box protein [Desulfobacteraceae bacterium]|nr:PAS domain S-box protein [Desulfobacteraceae bacterium]
MLGFFIPVLVFNNVHKEAVRAAWDAEIKTGANLLDYITNEEDRAAARMNFDRVLAGESFTLTQEFGEIQRNVWESTYNPIIGVDGQVNGLSVFSMDITKRWEAERLLKKSEEDYHDLYNTSPDMYVSVDAKTANVIACNQTLINKLGYTKEEIIGHPVFNLYTSECSKYAKANIFPVFLKTGKIDGEELQLKSKDGATIDVLLKITAVRDSHGNILHNRSIWSDITKQKRSEENLRRLATVVKDSNDAITVQDTEGNITAWNKGAEKMFGYSGAEALSMNITDIVPDDRKKEALAFVQKLQEEEVGSFETERMTKDGRLLDVWLTVTKLVDDQGKTVAIATTERDITERKKAEEKVRQAQKMEAIGRLAGGVAHDFNNMLSIILGNTEMIIEDTGPNNSFSENLKEIQNAAQRSTDFVRQLLAFARKQIISPKELNLNTIIDGMLQMLQRLIREDIELKWLPAASLWPINIDPSQIDQVLANLCVNSRDSIKGIGKITIETKNVSFDESYCHDHIGFSPGDYVMMVFSDNGSGMDKDTLDNLFEPFFTTKEVGQGTGLGLATIYGIVKQNKGFINVYSESNQGTTFKIYFPRYMRTNQKTETKSLKTIVETGSETILLVEDEKAILRVTSMMLERLGYNVVPASSPMEAIQIVEGSKLSNIDLLMTDVIMPEMNGRDLSERILRAYPNLKCLFMSGYTANVIANHGVLDKNVDFINKPFSKQDLAKKLRKVMDPESN